MIRSARVLTVSSSLFLLTSLLLLAQPKPGVLGSNELKKVVPAAYFFRGQAAPVQVRNTAGFRVAGDRLVLAGLVDTSGYAADVAEKYQGFLITEVKLNLEGSDLGPGQYGFGFSKDGQFLVMDVGANDVLKVSAQTDDKLAHPVPLKIVEDSGAYKLYGGRRWVSLKAQ